jgi:hypothetical protein
MAIPIPVDNVFEYAWKFAMQCKNLSVFDTIKYGQEAVRKLQTWTAPLVEIQIDDTSLCDLVFLIERKTGYIIGSYRLPLQIDKYTKDRKRWGEKCDKKCGEAPDPFSAVRRMDANKINTSWWGD